MNILTSDKYHGTWEYRQYKDWAESAQAANHDTWLDGMPVTVPLYKFLREIKAKRPHIILRMDNRPTCRVSIDADHGYKVFNTLSIAYPDTPDRRVGQVHYDDGNYHVMSPRIRNEKFRKGSDGYHTKKSKDITKMVKVALQFLKPFTFDELMEDYDHLRNMAIESVRDPARSTLRSKLGIDANEIATEIAHMIATGYAPATARFKEAVDLMASEGAELRRLRDYKPRTCFVWAKQNSLMYKYSDASEPAVEVTSMSDVPEHIRDKLALLNIAEERSAIADVGVRLTPSVFWVFV
jgi:hypothetical protein